MPLAHSVRPTPPATPPGRPALLIALCIALLLGSLFAASWGAVNIPLSDALRVLISGATDDTQRIWRDVLLEIRLPRVLFAIVAGAGLAIAGAAMQALFRNPLVEPGLIGISAGGALGAVAAMVLTAGGLMVTAPAAFIGSLAATTAAYAVGRHIAGVAGILLAGIAINTIASSAIGVLIYVASDAQLRNLTFWNLGSLTGASWPMLAVLAPWTALCSIWLLRQWRVLNALLLGEREAHHIGFDMIRVRRGLVIATALIVGPLVAATGGIAFVGLIVPHLVRRLTGPDHRWLLPGSLLLGALVLTMADWAARVLVAPAELPIGLVTGLIGGPFFLWLLIRARQF